MVKLEMDNRRKTGKFTNLWKLKDTLLNSQKSQWFKEKSEETLENTDE